MGERPKILFHQSPVDYIISDNDAWEHGESELDTPLTIDEHFALAACQRAVELKSVAGTPEDRTFDPASHTFDEHQLSTKRQGTFMLSQDLAKAADKQRLKVTWYGLADVSSFMSHENRLTSIAFAKQAEPKSEITIRLEESLAVRAEKLIGHLHQTATTEGTHHSITDGKLIVPRQGSKLKQIPLHGYEFNRSGNNLNQASESLPHLPSCEVFIATTVLDQIGIAPCVVRVVPYWMKDRELAAKEILQYAGHSNLPVLSVVAGESGDVERMIAWSDTLPKDLDRMKPIIQARMAHRTSTKVAKQVHDEVYKYHRSLYEIYNHPELDSNITPISIMENPYLSQRVHEFLSRTLVAAPLYERSKIQSGQQAEVLQDVLTLVELMGRNYQNIPLHYPINKSHVEFHLGKNTNDVTRVSIVLAGRPEEDPVLMPHSKQINLIGHFVFENLPESIKRQYGTTKNPRQLLLAHIAAHPARSVLIEARRVGPELNSLNN